MRPATDKLAKQTRLYRSLHKWVAIPLFLFMFLIGLTGLLLGWKKQIPLLPPTQRTTAAAGAEWLSLDSIQVIAQQYVANTLGKSADIDRMDVRPPRGIAKIRFADHFTEVQVDGKTGAILSVSQRTSDIVEMIHDGSILDYLLGTDSDAIKIVYTTLTSLGLLLLSVSGFFLWFNPRRIRKAKAAAR